MKRRIPLGITLALVILAAGISFVVTAVSLNKQYNRVVADFSQRSTQYGYLADIDTLVRNNYYGDVDDDALVGAIASGYIAGMGDSECMYLSASDYKEYADYSNGRQTGTGIVCYYDENAAALCVSTVQAGSPAADSGVMPGEYITAVDGTEVTADNAADFASGLLSAKSGSMKLTVTTKDRPDEGTELTVKAGYSAQTVFPSVKDGVGYVRVTSFTGGTADAFAEALEYFSSESVKSVIIDVRNNSGYAYAEAARVIDALVPVATLGNKAIATEIGRDGEKMNIYSSDSDSVSYGLAVLTNDATSGAAELLALDLRQFGKAEIYGEKTAGDAGVRTVFELSDGSALVLKTGMILPYMGDTFDGAGVDPDNEIKMTREEKQRLDTFAGKDGDAVYEAAFADLK